MNKEIDAVIKKLESYSELKNRERESIQDNLHLISTQSPELFIEKIRRIDPSEDSVLLELYEILSSQPENWVDFIISEFDRIEKHTIEAKNRLKSSVASPLTAISFFVRQEFPGIEKLISRIKKGISSESKQIIKISIDLLADTYLLNKEKYISCRQLIEKQCLSNPIEVSHHAKRVIEELDNNKLKRRSSYRKQPAVELKWYSTYSSVIFFIGLISNVILFQYYYKTFISVSFIVILFILSSIVALLIHYYATLKYMVSKIHTVIIGIGLGFILSGSTLYFNYKINKEEYSSEKFSISHTGTLAKGIKSSCRTPYVEFIRNNKIKRVKFRCEDKEKIDRSKEIQLVISKGFFGFDVIIRKTLL